MNINTSCNLYQVLMNQERCMDFTQPPVELKFTPEELVNFTNTLLETMNLNVKMSISNIPNSPQFNAYVKVGKSLKDIIPLIGYTWKNGNWEKAYKILQEGVPGITYYQIVYILDNYDAFNTWLLVNRTWPEWDSVNNKYKLV